MLPARQEAGCVNTTSQLQSKPTQVPNQPNPLRFQQTLLLDTEGEKITAQNRSLQSNTGNLPEHRTIRQRGLNKEYR